MDLFMGIGLFCLGFIFGWYLIALALTKSDDIALDELFQKIRNLRNN